MFGSKLAQKMWETTAEKGIGALLRPWQIRREGIAQLEVKRKELLVLAQTQRDVDDINNGKSIVSLVDMNNPKLISLQNSSSYEFSEKSEPYLDINALTDTLSNQIISNELQKEVNISKSLLVAESVLSSDQSEPTSEAVEDDWLIRWRDSAATSSSEKLQELWGRVLAGELKQPGSYSLRTIDFIKNLTQKEANNIQKLFSFVCLDRIIKKSNMDDTIFDNEYLNKELSFNFLSEMQSLGLITGVESMGLSSTFKSNHKDRYLRHFIYNDRVMQIESDDPSLILELDVIILTSLGREIKTLCNSIIDSTYINYVIDIVKSKNFNITIGELVIDADGKQFSKNNVIV